MALLAYLVAVVLSVGSIVLGFEWVMSPPDTSVAVASTKDRASTQAGREKAAARRSAGRSTDARKHLASAGAEEPPAERTQGVLAREAEDSASSCNIRACTAAYRSFRASDCTYQPYDGPRRLCEKGADGKRIAQGPSTRISGRAAEALALARRDASISRAQCNYSACAAHYQSFDPADCTYQPYDGGGRRICER